jgi:hypothetical protein
MAVSLIGRADLTIDEKKLIWKFNRGSKDAFSQASYRAESEKST